MYKAIGIAISLIAMVYAFSNINVSKYVSFDIGSSKHVQQAQAASGSTTATVTVSTSVTNYIILSISPNTQLLGNLTPGTSVKSTGTIATVTSNSANGYNLGLSDAVATGSSALVHTDTTTYIADFGGTIVTPLPWTGGTSVGLGISMFAADSSKEAKWGAGTTATDVANWYAAVPFSATTAHTVTGFHASADTSSWAFEADVPNTQKTGNYSGNVTFTATAVLS